MTSKKQRIQLDLSVTQQTELQRVRDQLDAASYAEVFRRALFIYGRILEAEAKNKKFGFIDDDLSFVEIVFI